MRYSRAKLGRNIRAAREKRNMSMEEMARQIGESEECVIQIEKGRKYITLAMLLSLCCALEVEPNELLEDVRI